MTTVENISEVLTVSAIPIVSVSTLSTTTSTTTSTTSSTDQFTKVTSVDFDHLSPEAQTGHVVLKVQFHTREGGRGGDQTYWVAVDQPGLWGGRTHLCTQRHMVHTCK